ncbi:MAG TPA: hypothetical protein VF457_15625 [Burkholderiaceae bacterium]
MPQLLTNATTQAAGAATTWGGGAGVFEVSGTLNGSTVTLQAKAQDGSFYDVPNTASTAGGTKTFTLPPCQIRANVTVAAPTSANAAAWRTRNP